jgi:flagellar motor protein MotB
MILQESGAAAPPRAPPSESNVRVEGDTAMPTKILAALSLAAAAVSGVGCAVPNWQAKAEQLQRENEDLERQRAQAEADLMAARARVEALERNRSAAPAAVPSRAGVTPAPYEIPAELDGKVQIRRRGGDTVIDVPSDVFFASGSSVLNRDGEKTMGAIVDFIKRNHPGGMIRVEGHSDADPIRRTKSKYHCNWELSFERAHAVVHWMVDKGQFDPHRVVCEAHGEFHPVDPANKSKNRRVEIVIAR